MKWHIFVIPKKTAIYNSCLQLITIDKSIITDVKCHSSMNERKALGIKQDQHSTRMHERMNYILCKHAINPEVFVHSFQE